MKHCSPGFSPAARWARAACTALAVVSGATLAVGSAHAETAAGNGGKKVAERSVSEWLMRMHDASSHRAYVGTFVVSSALGNLSAARIWHVCDGEQQMERVEALTGIPRTTLRRNDDVVTFLPGLKLARSEKRESFGMFPNMLRAGDSSIPEFYGARAIAVDRTAGFEADVVQIMPKDKLRFGYRIWSEKKTGLVMKLQTLDTDGRVIEQSAFSELQLDAPVKMEKLAQMMGNTEGYRVEKSELVKTTAAAEGWVLKNDIAGFKPVSCVKRAVESQVGPGPARENTLQWLFSDGLATVSLFLENYDKQRHVQESLQALGATRSLTRHLTDKDGDWWLTVLGEVPAQTLQAFAQSLERKK